MRAMYNTSKSDWVEMDRNKASVNPLPRRNRLRAWISHYLGIM